jgi:hypothetical protein
MTEIRTPENPVTLACPGCGIVEGHEHRTDCPRRGNYEPRGDA